MKYILTDVEGTTTSISFVHEVLFPYSKKKIPIFINNNLENNLIKDYLEQNKLNKDQFIEKLLYWIQTDTKEKILKDIQGLVWEEGYKLGEIKGHVYEEVPHMLKKWNASGIKLGVYSSGSIWAQKLIFKYSIAGDLDQYFSNNFDTSIGHKRDIQSYKNIISQLNIEAKDILFLSDIKEELDAAKACGMHTLQLVRDNQIEFQDHKQIHSFEQIEY